jgi:hypothetical protein
MDAAGFCKFPDLQRQVLEKQAFDQIALGNGLEHLFHFSGLNYGNYCLCFYIYLLFPNTRRECEQGG